MSFFKNAGGSHKMSHSTDAKCTVMYFVHILMKHVQGSDDSYTVWIVTTVKQFLSSHFSGSMFEEVCVMSKHSLHKLQCCKLNYFYTSV